MIYSQQGEHQMAASWEDNNVGYIYLEAFSGKIYEYPLKSVIFFHQQMLDTLYQIHYVTYNWSWRIQ